MFLCRFLIGNSFYTKSVLKNERRPPKAQINDSVIALPGPKYGHPYGDQHHREFVTYQGSSVYPKYKVTYRT